MKDKDKSELEQILLTGIHGTPELKREERRLLLGIFRERVLKTLTFAQIAEPGTYPEINDAIRDPRAKRLLISRKANLAAAAEYIRLAREQGLAFTTVDSPEYKGNVGLVVAAEEAVDVEDITVPDRSQILQRLGIPQSIINAKGKKICPQCWNLLKEKAPQELNNYKKMSWLDKLLGIECSCR